jgi:uncharacterized protein YaiI (UPF0178 family)
VASWLPPDPAAWGRTVVLVGDSADAADDWIAERIEAVARLKQG